MEQLVELVDGAAYPPKQTEHADRPCCSAKVPAGQTVQVDGDEL